MSDQEDTIIYRFTLKPIGPPRSETQIRSDVDAAVAEALDQYNAEAAQKVLSAQAEPDGPFLGVAAVAWWLLKTVAAGAAGAAGKKLFEILVEKLEKKDFDPGPIHVVPVADSSEFKSAPGNPV